MNVVLRTALRHGRMRAPHEAVGAIKRHRLATHASAVAFRVLVSLVPMALLGVGLLGAFGLESVWRDSISESLHRHLTSSVARALDDNAERIFRRNGAGLLALASALVIWNTMRAIREIEHALDEIHEQEGRRPALPGFAIGLALAVAVDVLVIATLLAVVVPPRVLDHGA
jgi:YihY family inner membrane protein